MIEEFRLDYFTRKLKVNYYSQKKYEGVSSLLNKKKVLTNLYGNSEIVRRKALKKLK
jgi:hypothetical protein